MGGSLQKAENGRTHNNRSIANAVSRNAWIFQVSGFRSLDLGFWDSDFGFRILGLGFWV